MNPHSLAKKRKLGAYYTPPELSQVLADWAIRDAKESILEPSFGGCGFFDSSITQLRELGCTKPENQLYGVDIDEHAFNILSNKFGRVIETKNRFILKDFIKVQSKDFSVDDFDVVLGNPPYVSMHNMTSEQRESCDQVLRNSIFSENTLGSNASLWAFFLLHSLSFLKEGGRVAWVLPSSLLHADYADKLLGIHQKHFTHIKVLKLAERFFKEEGAKETSIILMAEGFTQAENEEGSLVVRSVDNVTELKEAILIEGEVGTLRVKDYKFELISEEAKRAYLDITSMPEAKPLSEYVDIKIGMVTGANNYFIVNQATINEYNLPAEVLKPVVARFNSLQGIIHGKPNQDRIQRDGHRAFLVCPSEKQMQDENNAVVSYLSQISKEDREKNRTFKKRPNWFAPGWGIDGVVADAFLSYMIHRSPRMVVNQGKYNCTNSVHKVIFHDRKTHAITKRALAISMLSTFSQFSAELEGRAYSSGVLKIEPSAGKRIQVLFSEKCTYDLACLQNPVDAALRAEDYNRVTELVDNVFVEHGLILREQCSPLAQAVLLLRRERYKGVKNNNEN